MTAIAAVARDARHAFRGLRRAPGFAVPTIVTLALGIGATTAIMSLIDATLLTPLPVPAADRLVAVFGANQRNPYRSFVYSDYVDFRRDATAVSGLAAYLQWDLPVTFGDRTEVVSTALASDNYFDVVGVRPVFGRGFLSEEIVVPGEVPAAVVGWGLWQREFGGDADVLGKTFRINGTTFAVVGVAPRRFTGLSLTSSADLWVPMATYPRVATGFFASFDAVDYTAQRSGRRIGLWQVVGRLAPGVSFAQGQTQLRDIAQRLATAYPETNRDLSVTVVPAVTAAAPLSSRGDAVLFLWALFGTVGFVQLIGAANVANLFLSRTAGRRRELAVRAAVGGSRAHLVRLLALESLLLAAVGGLVGLAVAQWTTELLGSFNLPGGIPIDQLDLRLDLRVLAGAALLSVVTALAFGLAPARAVGRADLVSGLKASTGGDERRGHGLRLRHGLVAGQVALSLALLVGAGLFARSVRNALHVDLGFDPERVLTMTVDLGALGYEEPQAGTFYDRVIEQAAALPGVQAATVSSTPFGEAGLGVGSVYLRGTAEAVEVPRVTLARVGPDYFATLGMRLVDGRVVGAADRAGEVPVAVINAAMARRFWPDERAIGHQFNFAGPDGRFFTVVGVVGDAKYTSVGERDALYVYLPLHQHLGAAAGDAMTIQLRTAGAPAAMAGTLRALVREIDPAVPVYDVATLNERVAGVLMPQRMGRALLAVLAGLALLLSAVGIYGVVSYAVAQRTREFGLRLALGARPADVIGLIGRQLLWPIGGGLFLGATIALVGGRALTAFLFGVTPTDAATFLWTTVLLACVACLAALVPAVRAVRMDPMHALRYE